MPGSPSFDGFSQEISRLVDLFGKKLHPYEEADYDEASLRNDFLTPFWRALGWDTENKEGLAQQLREVEIETRVNIAGRKKRADYIFRTDGVPRFVCEAKKPSEDLNSKYAYQAQRYAFNLGLFPATLSNFKELQLFFVGGKPDQFSPFPAYRSWHASEYKAKARELWDLFARGSVSAGSLDRVVASLRKKPIPGKERRGWLWIPERVRTVDEEFLSYIEDQRVALARDLLLNNRAVHWDDDLLNESIQRILDRILFVRICEDRDIDTGRSLAQILEDWQDDRPHSQSIYSLLVAHFQRLDVTFNGALFRRGDPSEAFHVSDDYLTSIIRDLSSEDSPYLFSTLPVEILGSVYERFIGKAVGVTKGGNLKPPEYKPAARKAGGVYYTPRAIVDYIVDQTVGKMIEAMDPKGIAKLRFLDPACGSGSFLIRVFERICEHYIWWFQHHPRSQHKNLCFTDEHGILHLTTHLKREIMRNNIYGVDIDFQAVEVTMLSLYLKILEGETRSTLGLNYRLFPTETFLPDLSDNIKIGNSLVDNDYFDLYSQPAERDAIKAFDWGSQFEATVREGGFDAVIGNPPYVTGEWMPDDQIRYLREHYRSATGKFDLYMVFLERALALHRKSGAVGYIIPNKFMQTKSGQGLRKLLSKEPIDEIVDFGDSKVFEGVTNYPCIVTIRPGAKQLTFRSCLSRPENEQHRLAIDRSRLGEDPWNFSGTREQSVLDKIGALGAKHLSDAVKRFATGVQTGADKILIPTTEMIEQERLERRLMRRCLRGRNVRRYSVEWDGRCIVWPYAAGGEILTEKKLKRAAPHIYKRLVASKGKLSRRVWFDKSAKELSGEWFGLMYREPDSNFDALHIASPCLAAQCQFALNDRKYRYVTGTAGVLGIIPKNQSRDECLYLLGLLNSPVTEFFIKMTSPRFAGGYYKFTAPYLKRLPLPRANGPERDAEDHRQMCRLVETALEYKAKLPAAKSLSSRSTIANTLSSTERSINRLVYSMYGLSASDISVIEAALSA
jgi:hypothetical protein